MRSKRIVNTRPDCSRRLRAALFVQPLERRVLMAASTAAYSVVELAPVAGTPVSSSTYAHAVNSVGVAVGESNGGAAAWRVGGAGAAVAVALPGPRYSFANDVNDSDEVVGAVTVGIDANGQRISHAALWQPDATGHYTSYLDLGQFGAYPNSVAFDINNSGQVIGAGGPHAYALSESSVGDYFLWEGGVMRSINDLLPADSGWTLTDAKDINDAGQIVGIGWLNGSERGYRLELNSPGGVTIMALPGLTPTDETNHPYAINGSGHVAGAAYVRTVPDSYWGPQRVHDAYAWRDGVITDLGTLGDRGSYAAGMNDGDLVVGTSFTKVKGNLITPFSTPTATLWKNGTMNDLNKMLPPKSGWRLHRAYDVNNGGDILCLASGTTRTNDYTRTLLLRPKVQTAAAATATTSRISALGTTNLIGAADATADEAEDAPRLWDELSSST